MLLNFVFCLCFIIRILKNTEDLMSEILFYFIGKKVKYTLELSKMVRICPPLYFWVIHILIVIILDHIYPLIK